MINMVVVVVGSWWACRGRTGEEGGSGRSGRVAEDAVAAVVNKMAVVGRQGGAVAVVALEVVVTVVIRPVVMVVVEIDCAPDCTWGRASSGRTRRRGSPCPRR